MTKNRRNLGKVIRHQSGTALFISLIILVVMTILGISAMRNTVLETKMATNAQQRQIAYQAAEKALRDGEQWLRDNIVIDSDIDTNFVYGPDDFTSTENTTDVDRTFYNSYRFGSLSGLSNTGAWNDINSRPSGGLANVAKAPHYVIEYMGRADRPPPEVGSGPSGPAPDPRKYAFKITALGYGADSTATYLLSSTVIKCSDNRC